MMRTLYFMFMLNTVTIWACQICIPVPQYTTADLLLSSDAVVFAREHAERPFHYDSVATMKGVVKSEINLFMDSVTRRILKAYPERSVVLVHGLNGWERVGFADEETIPVVSTVLKSAGRWEQYPEERIDFFVQYLEHKNKHVRDQARLEVGRAPYDKIRSLGGIVSRESIYALHGKAQYSEWPALFILLLALTDDERDHQYIQNALRSSAKSGTSLHLEAWATASIEIDPEASVDFLESNYFTNTRRETKELDAVLLACSVQGTRGHKYLRDRLVSAYQTLLDHHPAYTPAVARDLLAWKRDDLDDRIRLWLAANPNSLKKNPDPPVDITIDNP